ncbi:MAG: hypothetical protein ACYTBS_10825 [Planctomycetota bacterium]
MSAKVSMSLDLPVNIQGTLFESEFEVLQEAGEEAEQLARSIWTGWKYGPNYPNEQRGTSNAAWRSVAMQPGDGGYTNGIELRNFAEIKARSGTYEVKAWGRLTGRRKSYANNQVGQYYAAYITRSGQTKPEWEVVFEQVKSQILPDTERRLRDRILENLGKDRLRETFDADRPGVGTQHFEVI